MIENFGAFFKAKQKKVPSLPKDKSPEDIHDEHSDALMHYLHEAMKLTHPDSDWHRVLKKMGGNSRSVNEVHKSVSGIIDKYGE